jgi:hypothetical protein
MVMVRDAAEHHAATGITGQTVTGDVLEDW